MNGVVSVMCVHDGKEHNHKTQEGGSSAYVSSLKLAWRLCVAAGMTKPGCGLRDAAAALLLLLMALLALAALVVVPPI